LNHMIQGRRQLC